MKRMKRVIGLAVVTLLVTLPSVTAFAQPELAAGKRSIFAIVKQFAARLDSATLNSTTTTVNRTPVVRPQQKASGVVVKRVWIGGPPWLGGRESTVTVVEKASEKHLVQTGEIQPMISWVGGPPWLGGRETLMTPK